MLRSLIDLRGYTAMATDGGIGTVRDAFFDDESWTIGISSSKRECSSVARCSSPLRRCVDWTAPPGAWTWSFRRNR